MALNNTDRFERDTNLEKYIDKLIKVKSIDTYEGSVVVIKDKVKKLPKNLDMLNLNFGAIKPIKGALACLLPDVRYQIIIHQAAWDMLKPANQKLALLYLLTQIKVNEKLGEPDLWHHDVKGYRSFYKKYGFEWLWDEKAEDPLVDKLKESVPAGE